MARTTHEYLLEKYGPTLTWQQASNETGIFWMTIRNMCLRGEIKTPRAGKKWVLTTKAIAEYLDGEAVPKETVVQFTKQGHRKIV